ncbi:hypothetical protein C8A05DRAFT_37207 [Staphylotrichum tortipilum]|uniref:Uncharacterized protein n=1 Tax=Staphylotrichum tortipilum TaxID=2831512 RepID=A0AAN6MET0_9PEZI|nr:hypothetical protein C8A05DRAFT_37207 [Staphylotrichum longicolle]
MTEEYPGWNLDLRWTDQQGSPGTRGREFTYPMGIHYNCFGADSEMLLVREMAMMMAMERLTDKPNWHVKVFDDEIAGKWKAEALAWPDEDLWERIANPDYPTAHWSNWNRAEHGPEMPKNILNQECVDYCILELRHKAEYFLRTGVTPTLDATFSIAKSDTLVAPELHEALREAFTRLKADQAANPDWHPNTNETVQDLVHPSMYPLVYGRSRFLPEELVGVQDAVDKWAGKGEAIPRRPEWDQQLDRQGRRGFYSDTGIGGSGIDRNYWSTTYQWLPANLEFNDDGTVEFTSYINNLHPTKYLDIYVTIEKLLSTALPLWDQCITQYNSGTRLGPGRHKPRLHPENPDDENEENWNPGSKEEMLLREAEAAAKATGEPVQPPPAPGKRSFEEEDEISERWDETREPIHPAIPPFSPDQVKYDVDPSKALHKRFNQEGLQVIVKMASIELTPEKPEFSPGGWHVEGMMNEHIVGTALYYLDSENITDSHLDFRAMTSSYQDDWEIGQDAYHWMESVYGNSLGGGNGICLQNYGSVNTPQGRLLAFPNVFQHRVSGFKLADPTKPGHRRFIALWLIDPFTRVISTANVPPQQAEWWGESAFGALAKDKEAADASTLPPEVRQLLLERGLGGSQLAEATGGKEAAKLPAELLQMVRQQMGGGKDLPMTRAEAEEHREKLMKERSAFQQEARDGWSHSTYSFCEH